MGAFWNDAAAIGHKTVDSSRKHLIELMRELEAQPTLEAARRTAQKLLAYTSEHLGREENLLRACGYPYFAEHAVSHRELTTRLRSLLLTELMPTAKAGHDFVAEMLGLVREWALLHVLREDLKVRPYVHRLSAQVKA